MIMLICFFVCLFVSSFSLKNTAILELTGHHNRGIYFDFLSYFSGGWGASFDYFWVQKRGKKVDVSEILLALHEIFSIPPPSSSPQNSRRGRCYRPLVKEIVDIDAKQGWNFEEKSGA